MWAKVKDLTGKNKCQSKASISFTADQLNSHYQKQSTDLNYISPELKQSVEPFRPQHFSSDLPVFNLFNKLRNTSPGADGLPCWLIKLIAWCIAKPVSHLYNLSINNAVIPVQWKQAVITPLPKITTPVSCADFRPISLTPIIARVFEKAVVRSVIYPIFQHPSVSDVFKDQFAFRPTGSTEAAIISILHHITLLLTKHSFVRVIALDFSKAFDTVRHSSILSKLSALPIDDTFYNWFVRYFQNRSHVTKFQGFLSQPASINASVFQGSAIGPSMFVINSSDLKPLNKDCYLDKYADDTYLIVPAGCDAESLSELNAIGKWAANNNLQLNKTKSVEMIVYAGKKCSKNSPDPPPLPNINRVKEITILGVHFDDQLSVHNHVHSVCQTAAQALYAIKLLKSHGLEPESIYAVCHATVLSRLLYAAPAWWGFTNAAEKEQLQAVLSRAVRWGFYKKTALTIEQACNVRDRRLFFSVLGNESHVLHQYLPPKKSHQHDLRARAHNRVLPPKTSSLIGKNFLPRMLYVTLD